MGRDKQNEDRTRQFAMWEPYEVRLPAWKALGATAQAAYMHFKIRCRIDRKKSKFNNNGFVGLSGRKLAEEMGINPRTAMSAMADLQAKGWIICEKRGHLGIGGKALAPEWRLTMLPTQKGTKSVTATYEPKYWEKGKDYRIIEYPKCKKPGHSSGDESRFRKGPKANENVVRFRSG